MRKVSKGGNILDILENRAQINKPIRVGLIGCGKFGTMFLSQALGLRGLRVDAIVDQSLDNIYKSLENIEWPKDKTEKTSSSKARKNDNIYITDDLDKIISSDNIDILIEATGNPVAGTKHILKTIRNGINVVNVTVEADALVGPILNHEAIKNGVIYSLAYGDQPALICDLVDWARLSGFEVICAGKGTKYLPEYSYSTPDTVWHYYGFSEAEVKNSDLNPKMFNSFLDGTKSAIEMCSVSNATGLTPPKNGLTFTPCGADELPFLCRSMADGGKLLSHGTVEVVSSLKRNKQEVIRDLRWGVFVVFKTNSDYVSRCFKEYGIKTDETGKFAAIYRPYHLIGLELSESILRVGLLGIPTGFPKSFLGDAVAVAKKDLLVNTKLDGEGGYSVYSKLAPAEDSIKLDALPIGLANNLKLKRDIKKDEIIKWSDVDYDKNDPVVKLRHEMKKSFCS